VKKWNTVTLAYGGLMAALAIVLSFLEIPMPFFAAWLKLDFSFVPMMLVGFSLGPAAGMAVLLITNTFHLLGSSSVGVGEIANLLLGVSFLLPALIAYNQSRTRKSALLGMLVGILMMVIVGVVSNTYFLIPLAKNAGFLPAAFDLTEYLIAAIIPFNILKGLVDCVITYIMYKRLSGILKKAKLESDSSNKQPA
jgi:riboflavin transporter